MSLDIPLYLQVAEELRRRILDGALPAGSRIPSRVEIAQRYGVSEQVARHAVDVLTLEGFVDKRPGSGSYVRPKSTTRRLSRGRYLRQGSPFVHDMEAHGREPSWEASSERTIAPITIAERLGITPGDRVMRTRYRYFADAEPVQLAISWEPLTITGGTPVVLPEEGPYAGHGVIERMDAIGVHITHVAEEISARLPRRTEAEALATPSGISMLLIQRTHYVDELPVETADITIPSDRYRVSYVIPVQG